MLFGQVRFGDVWCGSCGRVRFRSVAVLRGGGEPRSATRAVVVSCVPARQCLFRVWLVVRRDGEHRRRRPTAPRLIRTEPTRTQQLDKDINTFAMRVREWYCWHFPELKACDRPTAAALLFFVGGRCLLVLSFRNARPPFADDREDAPIRRHGSAPAVRCGATVLERGVGVAGVTKNQPSARRPSSSVAEDSLARRPQFPRSPR